MSQLDKVVDAGTKVTIPSLSIASLIPADAVLSEFFRYSGGLTTPTCNEIVQVLCCQHYLSTHIRPWFNQFFLQWTVFKNPINITTYQLNQFRSLLTHEKEILGKHEIVNFYGGFHQ